MATIIQLNITNTQVFDYMGTPANRRSDSYLVNKVNNLIASEKQYLSDMLGRELDLVYYYNNYYLLDIVDDYYISGDRTHIFLNGKISDIRYIRDIRYNGTILEARTIDNKYGWHFSHDTKALNLNRYISASDTIEIRFFYGFVIFNFNPNAPNVIIPSMRPDVQDILTQMVACKSNIWVRRTFDGVEYLQNGYTNHIKDFMNGYGFRY